MIRGRKPTPTHLKLVRGDPRKEGKAKLDRKVAREARLPPALPSPPPELSPEAQLEWQRLCAALHPARLLTQVDRGALAAVCVAYARWMQIERLIAKVRAADQTFEGVLIRSAKNNLIVNPLLAAARVAMNDYCRLCTEFGMTPSSRSRINDAGSEGDDPDDRFFDSA